MALDITDAMRRMRSPVSLRRAVIDARAHDRAGFVEAAKHACLRMLSAEDGPDLLRAAVAAGLVEYFAADPDILDLADAEWLIREAQSFDSSIELRLAQHALAGDGQFTLDMKFRLVDLLGKLLRSSNAGIPIAAMFSSADPRVRSRAAIALRAHSKNAAWLREHLQSQDARVRANALESLWPEISGEHEGVLRLAAMDANNRVRGNALYGLYLLRAEGVKQQILSMAGHNDPLFRTTAAWVMGETMDPDFLEPLQNMARTERGAVRMSALRALARLRSERRTFRFVDDASPAVDPHPHSRLGR